MLIMVEKSLRITLELEPGAEPIAGCLYADERTQHPFHGWLQFAAAIESACREGSTKQTGRGAQSEKFGAEKP